MGAVLVQRFARQRRSPGCPWGRCPTGCECLGTPGPDRCVPLPLRWIRLLHVAVASLYLLLPADAALLPSSESATRKLAPSQHSRSTVHRIAALFAVDAFGGGFLTDALVSYWFFHRFGLTEQVLGMLFLVVHVLNATSHLGAAGIAQRIGLVNTMVFTHLPSSLVNHSFDPTVYVESVPAERVAQFHIAGHSRYEKYILDTHDHPVIDPVWGLYSLAVQRIGPTATLLEWDDKIPSFEGLGPDIPEKASAAAQPRLTNHRHKLPPDSEVRVTDVLSGLHHEFWLEESGA